MNCPFCGAKQNLDAGAESAFLCGSSYTGSTGNSNLVRTGKCYDRQIYQLQVRAAYLENRLDSEIDQSQQYFEDLQACINIRIDLEKRLAAWREGDVAWDCLAEMASDYYTAAEEAYRCAQCHMVKPKHMEGCIVEKASTILQKLKDLGELD